MKKILPALLFLLFCHFAASAQKKEPVLLNITAELGLPVGQASQVYNAVIGAALKLEIPVSPKVFNITVSAGYSNFVVKNIYAGYINDAQYVPLEMGAKIFLNKIAYFEGDAGASFNVNSNYSAPSAALIFAPGLGFIAPTNSHKATIDIGIRYEGRVGPGATIGQVALHLAYRFAPGKK